MLAPRDEERRFVSCSLGASDKNAVELLITIAITLHKGMTCSVNKLPGYNVWPTIPKAFLFSKSVAVQRQSEPSLQFERLPHKRNPCCQSNSLDRVPSTLPSTPTLRGKEKQKETLKETNSSPDSGPNSPRWNPYSPHSPQTPRT